MQIDITSNHQRSFRKCGGVNHSLDFTPNDGARGGHSIALMGRLDFAHLYFVYSHLTSLRVATSTLLYISTNDTRFSATQPFSSFNLHTMTCRDEFPTRHNRASFLRTQRTLSNISDVWVQYRIHRARRLQFIKTRRKVRVWKRDMRGFRRGCRELLLKYKTNPRAVTAADWDTMTAGREKKLQITYGKRYSADKWPTVVPYLNLIAYAEYCAARTAARTARKARTEARLKKKVAAASRKAETTEKHAKAAENERSAIEGIPWRDHIAMEAIFKALEYKNKQMERQLELLRRSRSNSTWVSYEQWQAAIEGTDALETDRTIAGYVELARRREMGEPCDGWVFGRYFGP
jgi:hypothetical protein